MISLKKKFQEKKFKLYNKQQYFRFKFYFLTNFKPVNITLKVTRQYFCKNIFLLIYFVLFYTNRYLNLLHHNYYNLSRFTKHILNSQYSTHNYLKFNLINFNFFKILLKLNFFTNKSTLIKIPKFQIQYRKFKVIFYRFFKSSELNKNKGQFIIFHFLIFTKFFNHFVILRAPFRDKLSKNLFTKQQFYIFLNIKILFKNYIIFNSKY